MAIWDIVLTSPEDEKWHLVSNEVDFGLHHDCSGMDNPEVQVDVKGCHYCNELPPDTLWGIYRLAQWGTE